MSWQEHEAYLSVHRAADAIERMAELDEYRTLKAEKDRLGTFSDPTKADRLIALSKRLWPT